MNLQRQFGKKDITEIVEYGFLIKQRNQQVSLAFAVLGTPANLIVNYTRDELHTFLQLLMLLPHHTKCSSLILRNLVSFLMNFGLVQSFVLPASAITVIAKEDYQVWEKELDREFNHGTPPIFDRLDQRFIYVADEFDGTGDLRELMTQGTLS